MEHVPKINVFGLKMMAKRKAFGYFPLNTNSVTKMTLFAHGGNSILLLVNYLHILKDQLEQRNHRYSTLSTYINEV